ncbi:RpiB/LacA/LacB family sugar-phosphate isomerase [Candidatus Dependentiae bacterium]|nr:RpiB/LacA/LacB family sugar-phosphate isomerase [Candidatus Dependentiae bacterium]
MHSKIAIGSDHRGFLIKEFLLSCTAFDNWTVEWVDVGAYTRERSDYPTFGAQVAQLMLSNTVDAGVLLCGNGVGMAIVANRFKHIRAGLVWTEGLARMAKEDDNINVLVLPADCMTQEEAEQCVFAWLTGKFKGGRYAERLALIESLTNS